MWNLMKPLRLKAPQDHDIFISTQVVFLHAFHLKTDMAQPTLSLNSHS